MLIEINNPVKAKVDLKLIKKAVSRFARAYKIGKNQEISLALVSDQEIKKLNRTYRSINRPTDVLSFPGEGNFLGEIIIDYGQIKRQARHFGHSARQELIFILVHGLLHLIGYDDKTEKQRLAMIKTGKEFLRKLKV